MNGCFFKKNPQNHAIQWLNTVNVDTQRYILIYIYIYMADKDTNLQHVYSIFIIKNVNKKIWYVFNMFE